MRWRSSIGAMTLLLIAGCGATPPVGSGRASMPTSTRAGATPTGPTVVATSPRTPGGTATAPAERPSTTQSSRPTQGPHPTQGSRSPRNPTTTRWPDPPARSDSRWHFYSHDHHVYRSAWFAGTGKIMIGFGCTADPYYDADPRCQHQGFHHGVDVALPCRTKIISAVAATVVDPHSAGRLGPAYGSTGFRLRATTAHRDIVIGHANVVYVRPGQRVRPGQVIALVGARGAPDGCHLHFETRPIAAGYTKAVDPMALLALKRI